MARRQTSAEFTATALAVTDAAMAILYTAEINGAVRKVSENLVFDSRDQVIRAEVFHGAPIGGSS